MQEQKSSFPFSMIERMMPLYPALAVMGWMFVLIALLVGWFVLSPAQAAFFSDGKAIREGALGGSTFVNANLTSHALEAWLPQFKFLGLGLALLAIVMALGTIAKRLRNMGQVVFSQLPEDMRPSLPPPPKQVKLFQISAMMGIMILLIVLVVGLVVGFGVVSDYWNHSIATELNQAQPGSVLLSQLSVISSYFFWLNPVRMVGMAFLFTAITVALTVIIGTLRMQTRLLNGLVQKTG
ncbi:MAG: hypothetical protein JJE12_09350 [Anaerolineales bacterium]|nr:hypothetical protein [Anaerolineales bacterium]